MYINYGKEHSCHNLHHVRMMWVNRAAQNRADRHIYFIRRCGGGLWAGDTNSSIWDRLIWYLRSRLSDQLICFLWLSWTSWAWTKLCSVSESENGNQRFVCKLEFICLIHVCWIKFEALLCWHSESWFMFQWWCWVFDSSDHLHRNWSIQG